MAWTNLSARFFDALRNDNATVTTVARHTNQVTGRVTTLDIEGDAQITDDSTTDSRRSLSLTLPGTGTTWDLLNTPGGIVTVVQTVRYVDRASEALPMGRFIVDSETLDYGPDGTIQMDCPDFWLKPQRNKFGKARSSVATNTAAQEIDRLLRGAWPGTTYPFPGWVAGSSPANLPASAKVGPRSWTEGDRAEAIMDLVTSNGWELFSYRQGAFVIRKVPVLTDQSIPTWTVDASETGVMIDATRQRDRANLRNVIIAQCGATDVVFSDQVAANTITGDPLSITGPLGYVPEYWQSASFRSGVQALAAAKTRLSKRLGTSQTVTLTAVPNPALDSGDVIRVIYPALDANMPPAVELHIIDSVTHPLTPGGTQTIQTRSTRPLVDGGDS